MSDQFHWAPKTEKPAQGGLRKQNPAGAGSMGRKSLRYRCVQQIHDESDQQSQSDDHTHSKDWACESDCEINRFIFLVVTHHIHTATTAVGIAWNIRTWTSSDNEIAVQTDAGFG
jgi:hypothetical protein